MPVKRRKAKQRRAEVSADMIAIFSDREPSNPWVRFSTDAEFEAAWNEARDEILADWIADAPGSRPSAWWKYDAPRQPLGTFDGCYYDGKLPAPRERLGGVGTPNFEVLNYVPSYHCGIPDSWVIRADVAYYQPDFEGVVIDPSDPPRYESQASYLDRHGLFLPGEKKRVKKRDWQAELVLPDPDEAEADDAA